jgi:hypothetical protein
MRYTKGIMAIISLILMSGISLAEIHPLAGSTAMSFLKIGVGGRTAAMGEASVASVNDATACFWNPARLADIAYRNSFHFQHNVWLAETSVDDVYYVTGFGRHRLGFGGRLLSAGDIPLREDVPSQEPVDYYNAYDFFGNLSYAFVPSNMLSIGVSYRRLYEKIYLNSAYGHSLQMGLNFNLLDGALSLAGTVDNVGPRVQMSPALFKQPTTFKAGVAYRIPRQFLNGDWQGAMDLVKPVAGNWQLRAGTEFLWKKQLALRIGYKSGHDTETYSAGMGYHWRTYDFDYAFVPTRYDLGTTHRISLGLGF